MTLTAIKYAKVLWAIQMPVESLEETLEIYSSEPALERTLNNPEVYKENKHAVIDRIFPEETRNFLKLLCNYSEISCLPEIVESYKQYVNEHTRRLNAVLTCVTEPDEEQLSGFRSFLCRKYEVEDVEIAIEKDESLIGGFILNAEGEEYDWSLRGRMNHLQNALIGR